jgi:hypothetical protein
MRAKSVGSLVPGLRRVQTLASLVKPSSRHWSLVPTGLFLVRIILEATHRPWPGVLIVMVGLLAALGSFALRLRLARSSRSSVIRDWSFVIHNWPALLPLVYVLWPQRDHFVAASVAVLAALVWLLGRERSPLPRRAELLADGATFVVALAVYVVTAAPDVLPADFGEFQLVAALLGVAHPFGFPLYTMAGHLFIRLLPWGTPAYRLNLMSGVLAAGTLVLVARATRLWARRLQAPPFLTIAGGMAAALALGTATTFWAQATIANVRTPAVFFAALALYALARFATAANREEADGALTLLGLALGLGGGHYPPLVFVSLFFAIYVLLTDLHLVVQPRRWWRPLLAGLLGFVLPLAYLPIRGAMGAPLAPEDLDTLPGFLHHFLALGFGGDMFAFANVADLPHRLALLPTLFPFQFNLPLLAAALLGLLGLIRRDWRLFVLLAGSLALHTFVTITYRAPQTVEYLMPAYLPIAITVGLLPSLSCARCPMPAVLHPLLAAAVLWAGLLNGWTHGPSFAELAEDHTARQAVAPLLEQAPAGTLVLADWRWATPLWYLQQVEGLRPDVEVRYVYPAAIGEHEEEYRETWQRHVREADPGRPLLLTHFYEFPGYTTEPWEAGFLVRPRPVTEPVAPLAQVEVTFGNQVRLVGYSLRQDRFHPGQVAEFVLAWQPIKPMEFQPSFTLRLMNGEGRHVAQADQALGTDVAPGEVRFERLTLPLYPALPPGRYRVTLGAYTVTGTGFETLLTDVGEVAITLTDLELVPLGCNLQSTVCNTQPTPFTLHRQAVPFAGGPTLVGVDYDRSVPDVLRIYLHWRGSVREGAWHARVWTTDGLEAAAPLSPVPAGAYQTVGMDVQGIVNGNRPLRLALTNAQGEQVQAAGPWGWPVWEARLPAPASDARFVPLGDEMAVVSAVAHPAAPGETMAVDVTLVALRPLTSDDATSVRLMDADGRWLARHDMQPALSAVPTLKWVRGSRVVDRHLLSLPEDFTGEEVRATLVAYERFRMTSLPPMDGRFNEVPLGTWTTR